jgi:hypothetical protein
MATFIKITSVTVGSGGAATIDFTSIPSTYTDLCVKMSARDASTLTRSTAQLKFNDSSTGYSSRSVYGFNGTSTGSDSGGSTYVDYLYAVGNGATASTFSNNEIYIPNYASSNNKSVSVDYTAENNSSTLNILGLAAGLWSNSAAINKITITAGTANFSQYSTFTLYGIKSS